MIKLIYITTNLVNGKQYVGKHVAEIIKDEYLGSGQILNKAINKYGRKCFKRELLEICESKKDLNKKEVFWIKEKNTLHPNGYNLTKGGTGGDTFSDNPNKERTRLNRSKSIKKYWDNLSKEDKEKRVSKIRGKKRSDESKKRYSKAKKGIKKTSEHLKNLSKSLKKAKKGKTTYNQKSIDVFNINGKLINTFPSIAETARQLKENNWEIVNMCKGRSFKLSGQYVYKYHI